MAIRLFPVTPEFAAEIGEVDLRQPLAAEDVAEIRAAFTKYAVLIFPAQQLSPSEHLRFAQNFGALEHTIQTSLANEALRVRAEFADIANMDAQGRVWEKNSRYRLFQMGNRLWHTDSSFKAPTAYASLLYARSVAPIGGHTEFADQRAAYAALPQAMKQKLKGLIALHSLMHSRAKLGFTEFSDSERRAFAPVRRPLVRTLPETGRKNLYIASHAGPIEGMADEAAAALLKQLTEHAAQRQFVYTHRWRVGDLVMWDNRCTMHRGTEFEDTRWPRDMLRATTSDRADAFGTIEAPAAASAEY
jgi:alpha-ketoglutarate-dependent 2,4-dichlorophenoxyacetate dioxygenase